MKMFVRKILIFFIPLGLLFAIPCIILSTSGENFNYLEDDIKSDKPVLVGYAYNENNYNFLKWKSLKVLPQKTVVALGSSRVLQFRNEMFVSSFYNAGYSIKSIKDFLPFLKSIPKEKQPKILIIGLDQWMFNENWDSLSFTRKPEFWQQSFTRIPTSTVYKNVWKDLLLGKYSLFFSTSSDNAFAKVGLNAHVNQTGFRSDGSFFYGGRIAELEYEQGSLQREQFRNSFDRIRNGEGRFEHGKKVNKDAIRELDKLLSYCFKQKIKIVGFLPPYADAVFKKMKSMEEYDYLDNIYSDVKPVFKHYNAEIYDFSSVELAGSNDNEVIDGFHGGEKTYLKILIKMLESGSKLNDVTNYPWLMNDLEEAEGNYLVY